MPWHGAKMINGAATSTVPSKIHSFVCEAQKVCVTDDEEEVSQYSINSNASRPLQTAECLDHYFTCKPLPGPQYSTLALFN